MRRYPAVRRHSAARLIGAVVVTLLLVGAAPNAESAAILGRFKTRCGYSHSLRDDPIVHPGVPGASHLHDFFGNTTTDAATTTASLTAGTTTCNNVADQSAYWVPSLYDGEVQVAPVKVAAYYDLNAREPGSIVAYPSGLRMIAGDSSAVAAQPTSVTDWACIPTRPAHAVFGKVPFCARPSNLLLRISFPDCWDGVHLDSPDHRSHVAMSILADRSRHCPGTHPVALPQLSVQVEYPTRGGPNVSLSSGGSFSAHADFWNAWDPDELAHDVANCLNRPKACV